MEILKLVLTALLSVTALFIITKILGHKQIAQLDFFDYITGITIGSIAAELATELEEPWKPLAAMAVYGAAAVTLSIVANKYQRLRKYVNGAPLIVMNGGRLYRENMKKAKLDLSEFMVMCRQEGYFDLSEIQTAVFEFNGRLTILPTAEKRPLTPADMNLKPAPEHISTEVIMDGRIIESNLKRIGKDSKWLLQQLKVQGYGGAKEIYLGVCDDNKKLSLYTGD